MVKSHKNWSSRKEEAVYLRQIGQLHHNGVHWLVRKPEENAHDMALRARKVLESGKAGSVMYFDETAIRWVVKGSETLAKQITEEFELAIHAYPPSRKRIPGRPYVLRDYIFASLQKVKAEDAIEQAKRFLLNHRQF